MKSLIHQSLHFVSSQLQDEIHHLSKKGNAPEKSGFNFLSTLKKKFEKLQSEIDEYEEQEEMIGKSLEDIKAGGGRLFRVVLKCSASFL